MSNTALVLAALTFALGLGVGSSVAPVTASRSDPVAAPPLPGVPTEPISTLRAAHSAEVLRVLDGDTFEARVHLWPGLNVTTRVRLRGIDAPELNARCMDERIKAEAARDALRSMLDRGEVGIMRVALDKYGGRVLADARHTRSRTLRHRCSTLATCAATTAHAARRGAETQSQSGF
ncbi:MAG: nuclease [Xanthobacteraceae bacterium]